MKYIATTPQNGAIVEFTQEEFTSFAEAQMAVNGLTLNDMYERGFTRQVPEDMKKFFYCMKEFVNANFHKNFLKNHVENLDKLFDIKPDTTKQTTEEQQ